MNLAAALKQILPDWLGRVEFAEDGTFAVVTESGPEPTAGQVTEAGNRLAAWEAREVKVRELAELDKYVSRDAEEVIAATGANVSDFLKAKIARKVALRAELAGL